MPLLLGGKGDLQPFVDRSLKQEFEVVTELF